MERVRARWRRGGPGRRWTLPGPERWVTRRSDGAEGPGGRGLDSGGRPGGGPEAGGGPCGGDGPGAGGGEVTGLPWRSTLALTAITVVGSRFAAQGQPDREALDPLAAVLLVLLPALTVLRYRHPVLTVAGTAAGLLVYLGAGFPYGPVILAFVVACFAAVAAGHRHAAWAAIGTVWAGHLLIGHWLHRWLPPPGDGAAPWTQELAVGAWAVAVPAAAELLRARREQWARERAERAEAERRRADEERLRIARELHDVLAHSISVINVQAGVGLALLDQDPEQARAALTTIKAASKEALGEVRQVLGMLRTPGAAPRAPAPGLARLDELAEQAAGAGLAVDIAVEGTRTALPPGADLAAFRIVQEALTNIVRHSGSRAARVRLRYAAGGLEITVDDDGPATGATTGGGNGLVGMRERAAALGGTVRAGPRPDGGFRVRARLPVTRDRPGTGRDPRPGRAPGLRRVRAAGRGRPRRRARERATRWRGPGAARPRRAVRNTAVRARGSGRPVTVRPVAVQPVTVRPVTGTRNDNGGRGRGSIRDRRRRRGDPGTPRRRPGAGARGVPRPARCPAGHLGGR
ncbi:sensor histidine kinase [Streptomyces pactum]|uniref:histidine kinase n=1 Tax=Streptomyces pactum TaxID=68249 RepID=A0ABS0NFE9_9ACTN|nr:sensor histidine kinase [Streptomyces pactum]